MFEGSTRLTEHLYARRERGHTVLEFHGEIDIAAALALTPHLDSATARPAARVLIDLRHITFFDCSGLTLLCRARRRVQAQGGRLQIVCPHPFTLRVLRLTGLSAHLRPVATLAEALDVLAPACG